ncbi:MAG: LDL receptor domain-containing protein, partial [Deltaproteobacteria bacterium]|nr:LDL receptor domain-containing protein [Deltaproteobacteria bacterium]
GAVPPMACNNGGGGGAAPIDDASDLADVYQELNAFYCECYGAAYGYSPMEVDECLSGLEIATDAEWACVDAVYDANPEAFQVVRCQAEAIRSYVACRRAEGCPAPFMCGDGSSVPESSLCDGFADCANGFDEEQGCPPPFMCGDGQQVPPPAVCNGVSNCLDGSDEAGCPEPFVCGDATEVPASSVCDGFPDCIDGSDEQQDCPVTCDSQYEGRVLVCGDVSEMVDDAASLCFDVDCYDGEVVPASQRCDGTPDCSEGEDELQCDSDGGSTGVGTSTGTGGSTGMGTGASEGSGESTG